MPRNNSVKWKPILLVQIYRMVRAGLEEVDICKSLRIAHKTLWLWRRERPELQEAMDIAKKELSEGENFPDWIYAKLSPELKVIWNRIRKWEKNKNGVAQIEIMLQDGGKLVRQQLFLYALCMSCFSPSMAMGKVNITKSTLDEWISQDVKFAELVEEINWHKGNFFEQHLVQLVHENNPAATIFANKTYNKDRGYASHSTMDVQHSGQVLHGIVDLSELMPFLSGSAKLELLEAIRKRDVQDKQVLTVTERLSAEIAEVPI